MAIKTNGDNEVIVLLMDGYVIDVIHPKGIRVVVRNYDIEHFNADLRKEAKIDSDGGPYIEAVWQH